MASRSITNRNDTNPPPSMAIHSIINRNNISIKRKLTILHHRRQSPTQRHFTSSPLDPEPQLLDQDMAPRKRRSDAINFSSFVFSSSSPVAPRGQQSVNMVRLSGASSRPSHSPSASPSPSPSLSPRSNTLWLDRHETALSPRSNTLWLDGHETTPSLALSPLAQHVATLVQPLLRQLAAAAIDLDAARLEALGNVERQIELVELNRRTTQAALEKVVLEWARELAAVGGVDGDFLEVRRAAGEFESFKLARLAFVEEKIRRAAASTSEDDTDPALFISSLEPHDDGKDADNPDYTRVNRITHLRPPRRRGLYRKSTTAPSEPTHYAPNVYADDNIPSYLKYFVLGRYQYLTVPPPPTALSNFSASATTNSSSTIPSTTPTVTTDTIDQAARFPLHIPNRATGRTDVVHLPVHLANAEDWESKHWVWDLNKWHMAQVNARGLQPARHVRHKWNRNEREWLKAWVEKRTTAAAENDMCEKQEHENALLTRDWNDHAVTADGWRKGFRRRDEVILREAWRKLAKASVRDE